MRTHSHNLFGSFRFNSKPNVTIEKQHMHINIRLLWIIPLFFVLFQACKKDDDITSDTNKTLSFSTDTLTFDTVFTTLGSVTKRFKFYNRNDQALRISNIRLENGNGSQFRINVDGIQGPEVNDYKVRANDSVWVFVEVTVDPNDDSSPFVLNENIVFTTNGNEQKIVLEAWGQNAYYYRPSAFISGFPPLSFISEYDEYFPVGNTIDLPNDKPHVIFGYLVIDSAVTVNIPENTQLHFYDGAGMWAYRGSTLKVNGKKDEEVVFQGTRLEEFYDDLPGQWDRIILNEGPNDHEINHAVIKNGFIGLSTEAFFLDGSPSLPTNKLKLNNTIIKTQEVAGIFARTYNIEANNSVIVNSGQQTVVLQGGGDHDFIHCTLANYWPFGTRSTELFTATNHYTIGNIQFIGDQNIYMGNCIVYGLNAEEIAIDTTGQAAFDLTFDHCIVRTEIDSTDTIFNEAILNPSNQFGFPLAIFNNTSDLDFSLINGSPGINKGSSAITGTLTEDILGETRDSEPDLGAYEYVQ